VEYAQQIGWAVRDGGQAVCVRFFNTRDSCRVVAVGRFQGWKGRNPSAVDSTPPEAPQNIPIRASKGMTCPNHREIGSGRWWGFSLVVFPTPLLHV